MQNHEQNHHHTQLTQKDHIILLLQERFIAPFNLIYQLDQKQADQFKAKNQYYSSKSKKPSNANQKPKCGCCQDPIIKIPKQQMTKLQKIVYEIISYSFLANHLEQILKKCSGIFDGVKTNGQKDGLQVTNDVQKMLVDKILNESVNAYLLQHIKLKIGQENKAIEGEMGLWATPQTWYSKYPQTKLDFLPGKNLSEIYETGNTIIQNYFSYHCEELYSQLSFLQKDGRFQQFLLMSSEDDQLDYYPSKILLSPQMYIEQEEKQIVKFPRLKQIILMLKSIAFQMNQKMNLYCSVNDSVRIQYYVKRFKQQIDQQNKNPKYSQIDLLLGVGGNLSFQLQQEKSLKQGELLMIDSAKHSYSVESSKEKMFLIRSMVKCPKIKK